MVRADKNALSRILHNLTFNILKYGSSKAEISLTETENEILLSCSNPAPYLTKEDAEHLFDPFLLPTMPVPPQKRPGHDRSQAPYRTNAGQHVRRA